MVYVRLNRACCFGFAFSLQSQPSPCASRYVMLTLGESVLVEGEGAQTNTLRWEDYAQTAVDPSDDCTIWYVGDYLKKDATSYSTKIGGFQMPGC